MLHRCKHAQPAQNLALKDHCKGCSSLRDRIVRWTKSEANFWSTVTSSTYTVLRKWTRSPSKGPVKQSCLWTMKLRGSAIIKRDFSQRYVQASYKPHVPKVDGYWTRTSFTVHTYAIQSNTECVHEVGICSAHFLETDLTDCDSIPQSLPNPLYLLAVLTTP